MVGGEQQHEQLHLHVVKGPMQGEVAVFPAKKKVTIGRTRVNAFPIKHDTVSQRHAFIVYKGGLWFVTDSSSCNGTSINSIPVTPGVPTELRNGDRLGIGPENELCVKIREAEESEGADVDVEVAGRRQQQHKQDLPPSQTFTVKDWFEAEDKRLAEENEVLSEKCVKELEEYAEVLKKIIWEAAGVEYPSVS